MTSQRSLEGIDTIHIVGAGGAGMSGLGKLLASLGHQVSGSDLKPSPRLEALTDLGIRTWVGHRPEEMTGIELVVTSSAVPAADPEVVAAQAAGALWWERPELLDALTHRMPTMGFTGTHGKTTSTALAITALRHLGIDPSFLVGGQMVAFNTGAHLGKDDEFVLEADEAFGTFRKLHLDSLMVTNIEADHLDYYGTVSALEEAFALVATRVDGPVVACIDDPGVRRLAARVDVTSYGTSQDAVWRIDEIASAQGTVTFDLAGPGYRGQVAVPKPGEHIARNAAGVVALLSLLGHDPEAVVAGLASFAGVRRRFEVRSRVGEVTVVDDYAHHPTEIAATIAAGRQGGWGRVWAVFQPHRYTRTAEHGPAFGEPLAGADKIIVTDVYSAGEAPVPGVSGRLVAESVQAAGGDVEFAADLGAAGNMLASGVEPGDLVLLLGAGDINSLAEPLALQLEARK
ncbi:MAG: UDP-N-acetylmuramate--L-alanine ligase [Acidimicrobiia bacterium]|nr:UDP-N-acetylmuramate--L-alanine ligase [Acidimicrobiia bacterium]